MGVMYKLLKHRYNQQFNNNNYSDNNNNNSNNNSNNINNINISSNNHNGNAWSQHLEQQQLEQHLQQQQHQQHCQPHHHQQEHHQQQQTHQHHQQQHHNRQCHRQQQQQQQQQRFSAGGGGGGSLTKDLIKTKLKAREKLRRTITLDGHIVEQPLWLRATHLPLADGDGASDADMLMPLADGNEMMVDLLPCDDETLAATAATASTMAVATDVGVKEFTAEHILQLCKFLAERAKKNKNLCKIQRGPKDEKQALRRPAASTPTPASTIAPIETTVGHETLMFTHPTLLPLPDVVEAVQRFASTPPPPTATRATKALTSASSSPPPVATSAVATTTPAVLAQHHVSNAIGMAATPPPRITQTTMGITKSAYECRALETRQTSSAACGGPGGGGGGKRDILLKIRRQIFERKRQRQLAAHVQQRLSVVWRPW